EAAQRPRLFPFMKAVLTAYPLTSTETQLDFSGRYLPPLGALGKALDAAVKWGDLSRNVAALADPPRARRSEKVAPTWTGAEVAAFLESVRTDRLQTAYLLLATTGLRRGEALGLRWENIDLDAGRLAVVQTLIVVNYSRTWSTPKTKAGRRSVYLDQGTVSALRGHRTRQVEERTALGIPWPSAGDLVFAKPDGSPLNPDGFSDRFDRLVTRSRLPRITPHGLRHTHATLALQAGISPKVVSERLGHSNVGITLDTYSHVIPALEEAAAERVAALVFGAVSKSVSN
ncbi:MAG: site-specific integrase, partial [Dehalococcoidia bacterium]